MYKSIGIDFGTSASYVASVKGTPQVIFSRSGKRFTPSVVAVNNDRISVGEFQKPGAVADLKRIIGLPYHDSMVERYMKDSQIKLEKTSDEIVTVPVNGKQLRVEQVIALQFRDLAYNLKITKIELAVITVPASFGQIRRQAIQDAVTIAGFHNIELIDETTAAAVYFAKKIEDNDHRQGAPSQRPTETILIFQLGGGTIDVAIFKITTKSVELVGSASSCDLGGIEFDRNLLKYLAEKRKVQVNDTNRVELMRLCKEAKEFLTSAKKFDENDDITITKDDVKAASQDLLTTINAMVDLALDAARLNQVDEYILIGRGSQIPCVEDMIEKKLGKRKRSCILDICEAAVNGAAIYAKTMRSNSKRNSHFGKRIAKIPWKTEARSITMNGNQIIDTYGISKKRVEKLISDSLKKLPKTGKLIKITVRTELAGHRQNEITKLKKDVDDLIDRDKELQRLEKKISDLENDLFELQENSVNHENTRNWCNEKLKRLRDHNRISEKELDECKRELKNRRKEFKGEKCYPNNAVSDEKSSQRQKKETENEQAMLESSTASIAEKNAQTCESSISAIDEPGASTKVTIQRTRSPAVWKPIPPEKAGKEARKIGASASPTKSSPKI